MRESNPNNQNNNEEVKEPQTAEEYMQFAQELMGDTVATQQPAPRNRGSQAKGEVTYQDQVSNLLKEVTVGEDGKFVYPDNTPEHLKYAVAAEKKYRDTQRGFTKANMSLKEVETENEALRNKISSTSSTTLELSKVDADRLEDLMYSNPAEWRKEMNDLESKHLKATELKLNETMGDVRKEAGKKFELERRIEVLRQFNTGRKNPVTVEMLDGDVPPRITKKLSDGYLTFEGYLAEVDEYLNKGKVVGNPDGGDNGTKLTSGAGSHTPPKESAELEQGALDYASTTF